MNITAISLLELLYNNNRRNMQYARNCKIHRISFNSKKNAGDRFLFLVRCRESYSAKLGHIVSLLFDTDIYNRELQRKNNQKPLNTDIKLKCSCPAHTYWGTAYNSTVEDYNLDIVENRFPGIRDPNNTHKMCKHATLVAKSLRHYSFYMLEKKAKVTSSEEIPTVGIQDCLPVIGEYIQRNKLDGSVFDINEDNFEDYLISLGMIV